MVQKEKGAVMKEKRNLKGLVPEIQEKIADGRDLQDIYDELELDKGQRQTVSMYLRRNEPIAEEVLVFMPERIRPKKYITFNGKRYQDITADFFDCGG